MLKYNINSYMYVQISQEGLDYIKKTVGEDYLTNCILPERVSINNETWYRLQCWKVFELFPRKLIGKPYFATSVMFDENEFA